MLAGDGRSPGRFPSYRPSLNKTTYLPDPDLLRPASLGFRQLVADLLFFQLVQAVGDPATGQEGGFVYLAEYCDLITELDPRNSPVYLTSSFWLLSRFRFEESTGILTKGWNRFPREWKFPYYLGLNEWLFHRNRNRAIEYFHSAMKIIDDPAIQAEVREGAWADPESAFDWFEEHYQGIGSVRHDTERTAMLSVIRHARFFELVEESFEPALACHREARQADPATLEDLVTAGCWESIPTDPYRGSLYLDASAQELRSTKGRASYWWEKIPRGDPS